jgi:hypothetical protein
VIWRLNPSLELHETTVRENAIDETVLPDLILMMSLYWPKDEAVNGAWFPRLLIAWIRVVGSCIANVALGSIASV